ncbi:MAG: AAA family ATPase [Rickettsiales bacterium]
MSKQPFLAFATDTADIEVLKKFAGTHGWDESCIMQGDVSAATQHLKDTPSPKLLLVEIPASKDEASSLLDGLAAVCDPDTKVIAIGSVNEYSFYCWLMDLGLSSYLLRPLTEPMLEGAFEKSVESKDDSSETKKKPAKTIAVMGTRGGVGATTISTNLAAIIADLTKKEVALVDIDPQEGSIALMLDLEPGRGFRDALEKPDRIDSLFMERVMTKPHKRLSVLAAEEAFQEKVVIADDAATLLIKELKAKYDVLVLDIPRHLRTFSRQCLEQADHVVLVTELSLVGLRDTLRLQDMMREGLKMRPPVVVANRVKLSKHDMKEADFAKGIGGKVEFTIPFSPDIFIPPSEEIPALKFRSMPSLKGLYKLAEHLEPEAKSLLKAVKEKKGFSLLGGGKKKEAPEKEEKKEGGA